MRLRTVRARLVTATLLVIAGLGWVYLAPTEIGGSTSYVITHGTSMEPMFHTGDLALVRPSSHYRVGQIVAYHSSLLHTVVLHRIIGREGSGYVFKGDNNHFIDATRPTRAELIGRLWLRIPHGGVVLAWLHFPPVTAVMTGAMAMLLLLGTEGERRRRDRRRKREGGPVRPSRKPLMSRVRNGTSSHARNEYLFSACAVAAVVSAAVGLVAFARSATKGVNVQQPYSQVVSFGYHARVPAGLIYPSGVVSTGEPVYAQLVHRLTVTAAYHLATTAPHQLRGSVTMLGTLANSLGWSRTMQLAPPRYFVGEKALATVNVDLPQLRYLAAKVGSLIGDGIGESDTFTISPHVKLSGAIAGKPVETGFSPSLTLQLGGLQILPGGDGAAPTGLTGAGGQQELISSQAGAVTANRTAEATLAGVPVDAVRWTAVAVFALAAGIALLIGPPVSGRAADPTEQIKARYRRLIVPISGVTPDPARPPIEVTSMEALALLAERSERLILHDHRDGVDSYLIDDQGTLYRYRAVRGGAAGRDGSPGDHHNGVAVAVNASTGSPHAGAGPGAGASGGSPGRVRLRHGATVRDDGRVTDHDSTTSPDAAVGALDPAQRSGAERSDEAVEPCAVGHAASSAGADRESPERSPCHAASSAGADRESPERSPGLALDASTFWPYVHASGDGGAAFSGAADAQDAGDSPVLMFASGSSWPHAGSFWPYAELAVDTVMRSPDATASGTGKSPDATASGTGKSPDATASGTGEPRDYAVFEHRHHSQRPRQAALRVAVALTASALTWRLLRAAAART